MNPLIVGAAHGSRKRDCDKAGLQRAEECGDVVKPLWCQYQRSVTGGCATAELVCNIQSSPIDLRPGEVFGYSGPILVVIDERECRVIGLQAGALAQHSGNGLLKHVPEVTVAIGADVRKTEVEDRLPLAPLPGNMVSSTVRREGTAQMRSAGLLSRTSAEPSDAL